MSVQGLYWYISYKCNLQCKHCWISCSPDIDTDFELDKSGISKVLDDLDKIKPEVVMLTGGEPMMHPHFYYILDTLLDRGILPAIETNGMFITSQFLSRLESFHKKGINLPINISVDGGTRENHDWLRGKGSYKKTIKGMKHLTEQGFSFEVQFIGNKRNIDGVADLFEILDDFRVSRLKFGITFLFGRASENEDELNLEFNRYDDYVKAIIAQTARSDLNVVLKLPPIAIQPPILLKIASMNNLQIVTSCQFPMLGILPSGDITVCALTKNSPDVCFGNIMDNNLAELVGKSRYQELVNKNPADCLVGICAVCRFQPECRGSCRAQAYEVFGSFNEPLPLCHALHEEGLIPDIYMRPPQVQLK